MTPEESVCYSDFSGKCFDICPQSEVRIEFNYGSGFDGESLTLHLTEEEAKDLLKWVSLHLTEDAIESLSKEPTASGIMNFIRNC